MVTLPPAAEGGVLDSIFVALMWLQWNTPVGVIACAVLGYFVARKTHRSVFNWVLVGAINGIIPVVGPVLMVVAYFFYPPPPPSSRPGYNPPPSARGGAKRSGTPPRDRR